MEFATSLTELCFILVLILVNVYKDADANNPIFNFECPKGYYGENCDYKCSEYCYEPRQCDSVTGQCYGGCQPGWYTKTCEQKCPFGTFGNNCRRECGYCVEKYYCHHINGSCLNGCLQGYRGEQCKHQCVNGYYGKNCDNKCSRYCFVSRRCDSVTGRCYGGCKPGWYTNTCEQNKHRDILMDVRTESRQINEEASSGIAFIPAGSFVQVAVFAIAICVF